MCIGCFYYNITLLHLNISLMHRRGTYYRVTRAVVLPKSTQGTCHCAPFSTTHIRTRTVVVVALAVIGSNTTSQSRLFREFEHLLFPYTKV
jgi:hypothetical protein